MLSQVFINGKEVCQKMRTANNFMDRLIGLMFKKEMIGYDALLIEPCRSIHTFFMFFSIDVLFISADGEIVKIVRKMSPWRLSWIYFRATKVLELKANTIGSEISEGDKVEVVCTN